MEKRERSVLIRGGRHEASADSPAECVGMLASVALAKLALHLPRNT